MGITGFMQNKGQVIDQNNNPQPEVKYLYNGNNFKLHLRTNSFSYELYSIEEIGGSKGEKKVGPMDIEDIPELKSTPIVLI